MISRWGTSSRSSGVDVAIEAALGIRGLTTVPNFRKVGLDTPVRLQLFSQLANLGTDPPGDGEEEEALPDRGLTVGDLPSGLGGVESLSPQSTFDEAITKMLLNDYSQLAVLSSPFNLRGASLGGRLRGLATMIRKRQ